MSDGLWVKVYPSGEEIDPTAPTWNVTTVTGIGAGVRVTWTAAVGAASYEVSVNGVVQNVGNVLTHDREGLTVGQSYAAKVRPVSASGVKGAWSSEKSATALFNGNIATGGTVTDVTNYNGTGQTWRVHRFNSNDNFVVSKSVLPFRVLLVGGGHHGANTGYYSRNGYGGGGGKIVANDSQAIAVATHTVTIGAGGGGNSSVGSLSSSTGSIVGGGGHSINCCNTDGWPGGAGLQTTITGTPTYFGGGGGGGGSAADNPRRYGGGGGAGGGGNGGMGATFNGQNAGGGGAGQANTGGGGGGAGSTGDRNNPDYNWNTPDYPGGPGGSGTVIVAYRIA